MNDRTTLVSRPSGGRATSFSVRAEGDGVAPRRLRGMITRIEITAPAAIAVRQSHTLPIAPPTTGPIAWPVSSAAAKKDMANPRRARGAVAKCACAVVSVHVDPTPSTNTATNATVDVGAAASARLPTPTIDAEAIIIAPGARLSDRRPAGMSAASRPSANTEPSAPRPSELSVRSRPMSGSRGGRRNAATVMAKSEADTAHVTRRAEVIEVAVRRGVRSNRARSGWGPDASRPVDPGRRSM